MTAAPAQRSRAPSPRTSDERKAIDLEVLEAFMGTCHKGDEQFGAQHFAVITDLVMFDARILVYMGG